MVTADRPMLLKRSLISYCNQTYNNTELIVVDDGQEDLAPLLQDLPGDVKYLKIDKKPENVLGHLRNISLEAASGEFITQWDDDDWYHPQRLQIQADALLQGYDACCLSHTLMHIDKTSFLQSPYVALFRRGTPGSIMHRRNEMIRYPALRRGEDDIYLRMWSKKRLHKLPQSYAHLFIRCFHGSNTWHMKHFLEQIRNTLPDYIAYICYCYIAGNLFMHPRFQLDGNGRAAFSQYLQDSFAARLFDRADFSQGPWTDLLDKNLSKEQ